MKDEGASLDISIFLSKRWTRRTIFGSFLDRKWIFFFFFLSLLIHPFCDSCALFKTKRQWHKIFFLFKVLSFFFLPRSSSSFGSIYFKWTSCHRPKKWRHKVDKTQMMRRASQTRFLHVVQSSFVCVSVQFSFWKKKNSLYAACSLLDGIVNG